MKKSVQGSSLDLIIIALNLKLTDNKVVRKQNTNVVPFEQIPSDEFQNF